MNYPFSKISILRCFKQGRRWPRKSASLQGFTLVETLVAIAIIMVAITGPYAAAEQAITAARIAQDRTIATFLAQEGVEAVRAERDKTYINDCVTSTGCSGSSVWWGSDFADPSGSSAQDILRCSAGTPCALISSFGGLYWYPPSGCFNNLICNRSLSGRRLYSGSGAPAYYNTLSTLYPITPFTRTIYASAFTSEEVKITSEVTWKENGTVFTVTATDHLTPWFTGP
ncbi:MAG: hypothetical protein B7X04_01720 [Parcubacteria group bacterium 21-54-25]|nr:MAG: hypothetical protein B7X04_01720 [Parcubacteria group bacterium 21-54-25]HQU07706.1 prepilin-type N-terminal cleavage/methylation domain-containing protein [Candidatus Paceibacterota bacterium]